MECGRHSTRASRVGFHRLLDFYERLRSQDGAGQSYESDSLLRVRFAGRAQV